MDFTWPIVIWPPFPAKHKLKDKSYPLKVWCFLYKSYNKGDVRSGESPNIPFAYCFKNKLLSLMVQPNDAGIPSAYETDSNWITSLMITPSRELP